MLPARKEAEYFYAELSFVVSLPENKGSWLRLLRALIIDGKRLPENFHLNSFKHAQKMLTELAKSAAEL